MDETRPILSVAIVVCCVALLTIIILPNFNSIGGGHPSPKNTCINNLRLLDTAVQQWALEHNKTNSDIPTWADVMPYLSRSGKEMLKCPLGGTYTFRSIYEKPTCSVTNHVLP
jgi:hypothetical protein